MATLHQSSGAISMQCQRRMMIGATINLPRLRTTHLSPPKLPAKDLMENLSDMRVTHIEKDLKINNNTRRSVTNDAFAPDSLVMAKLYAIMEVVADRVEMHNNIGEQRNNWNHLLLNSVNTITLAAATMAGIAAAASVTGAPLVALKLSSSLMYVAATGFLTVMNKIQPSQLVEEQRNSVRLFKQLHAQIQTKISLQNSTMNDVNEAMDKVLALDKAYPLPLLGQMLDKFPATVKPAVWWPQKQRRQNRVFSGKMGNKNDWDTKLEEEMREVVEVMKRKDIADYMRLSKIALKLNKVLAISGPLLTGIAAIGSLFLGAPSHFGTWAAMVAIVGGALASVVNAMEHGGQVGMVFEMYRNTAGFFSLMEETIESNLNERELERRENGELFEMKVALQLGRSLSELKHLKASSSSRNEEASEEFASKLF